MYNIGVIGCGIIAVQHLEAIEKSGMAKTAAVVDICVEKAEAMAKEYNCTAYSDYREIKESLDAVIINLPHFLHCEVSCYFLDKGINVLVEKPMANTYAECLKMIEASERSGAKLAVGHVQRFNPGHIELNRYVREETFGKLAMTSERRTINYFASNRPKWFFDKKMAGGGIVMNYGAHSLDKIFYVTGGVISSVSANLGNYLKNYDVDGHAQFFLKFKEGFSSSVTLSGYHGAYVEEALYYFEKATVKITPDSMQIKQDGDFEIIDLDFNTNKIEAQFIEFLNLLQNKKSEIAAASYSAEIVRVLDIIKGQ